MPGPAQGRPQAEQQARVLAPRPVPALVPEPASEQRLALERPAQGPVPSLRVPGPEPPLAASAQEPAPERARGLAPDSLALALDSLGRAPDSSGPALAPAPDKSAAARATTARSALRPRTALRGLQPRSEGQENEFACVWAPGGGETDRMLDALQLRSNEHFAGQNVRLVAAITGDCSPHLASEARDAIQVPISGVEFRRWSWE